MDVFDEEDAELFFGRERLVDDLVGRVKESRTVFITGPSGSGKSSLVRAGLIHALKQGAIKEAHSERWLYATIKPGRDAFEAMKNAFSRLKSPELGNYFYQNVAKPGVLHECAEAALSERKDQRLVLFIDQFEEVFTQISKEEERVTLLDLLTHAATTKNGRVIVLFSMRSDFVSNCATYPKLNAILNQQFVQIGGMQPDELVSAIAQPALRVGLRIDPDLIAQIINDMQGEPGALPLMQFALKDLFDSQQVKGGLIALTLNDYLGRGGIHKSLERHADKTFASFNAEEQELARSIFSSLIEIGRGTQDTRRTANFDELVPASIQADEIEGIVRKLADARLVTTDEVAGKDTVTISHEKLIDAWPWLKKLVNENRDIIALQNEIAEDAKEWEEHKRDASYLYSGARLVNAREQLKANKLTLSGTAHDFVQAGFSRQQREQRARILSVAGVVGLIIAGIVLFSYISTTNANKLAEQSKNFANTQVVIANTAQAASTRAVANEEKANELAQISRAGELAAQSVSLREKNFLISLLLSVEAYNTAGELSTSGQVRNVLLENTQTNPQLEQFLSGHSGPVESVAFSPDGKTLASGSGDNTIILWDTGTRQPSGQPLRGHSSIVSAVVFSPDGKILASGDYDGTIILWNVETHESISQLLNDDSNIVFSLIFSPNGKVLISRNNGSIILWDIRTHKPIGQPIYEITNDVVLSPDGKMLAFTGETNTTSDSIILWDVDTQLPISGIFAFGTVYSLAFSPDSRLLASGSDDGNVTIWDVETHERISESKSGHSSSVVSTSFSPDGRLLASGSFDNNIIIWDVANLEWGSVVEPIGPPLKGHSDIITDIVFSPDGKTLASGSSDKEIIFWDVETFLVSPITQTLYYEPDNSKIKAVSQDWKTIALGSFDTIILQDMETQQKIGQPLKIQSGYVSDLTFSSDGKMLASGTFDIFGKNKSMVILWGVESQKPIGQPLKINSGNVSSLAFSTDGKLIATGSNQSTVILWDIETRQPIGQPLSTGSGTISSLAFSQDDKFLATGTSNLISGSFEYTIIVWDVETRQPIGQPMNTSRPIVNLAFSADSKMLASGISDNTIILWDAGSLQSIGQPLNGYSGGDIKFGQDSKLLVSQNDDNTLTYWGLDPIAWVGYSCQRAGRNFTFAEWKRYFPDEEYRKTCEQWPLEPEITTTPTANP